MKELSLSSVSFSYLEFFSVVIYSFQSYPTNEEKFVAVRNPVTLTTIIYNGSQKFKTKLHILRKSYFSVLVVNGTNFNFCIRINKTLKQLPNSVL